MKKVAIIMGSDSDLPVLKPAVKMLAELEIPFDVRVMSAHRTPAEAADFARNARAEGYGVIIAAAGKAAHLAGALAAQTILPVIGVPVKSSTLDGLDALHRADAGWDSGGDGGNRRSAERGAARGPDACAFGRGVGGQASGPSPKAA